MDLIGNIANLKVDTVLSAVDKYVPGAQSKIKNLADKAKAYVNNVTELEMKVLEATNHEPWGPHGTVMQEITQASFNSENFYQIMGVLDQRLQESPENWRLVYKTLLLLEYMCKHGPMAAVEALVSYSRISHLEKLRDRFEFKDNTGRDQGVNVRQRAGALVSLVQDRDKLAEERDKAAKNKSKYTGVSSSSSTRYGGFSGGSSSYGSGGYGSSSYGSGSSYAAGGSSGFSSSPRDSDSFGVGTTTSSSSRLAAGAAGGDAGAAADAVEATRRRIERLKAEGAIADSGSDGGAGLDAAEDGQRKPKKLSDIKINPAISAAFAGGLGGLAPPPAAGSRPGGGSSAAAAPAASASSGIDLLGDLTDGPVAAPSAVSSGAAGDDWGAFDSAPATASSQKKPAVDINSLLGPIPTTAPAASGGKAPLPLDDFCSMPAAAAPVAAIPAADDFGGFAAAAPAPAASSSADPFGPFVATGGSAAAAAPAPAAAGGWGGASDPFAASGTVHMVPQAAKHHPATGPKLGPETAKAKDPFADLAML